MSGRAEEYHAEELGECQQHDAADEGQGGYAAHGIEHVHAVADAVHHAQVYEELAREAVQGRQGAYGGRGQQEQRRRDGHALGGAAEVVEQRGVHLRVEVARAEVQQRLEERVVERVQQGAAEGYRRHDGVVGPGAEGGYAQGDEYDADVLHARVCEQPLGVVLRGGLHGAPQSRHHAHGQQDDAGGVELPHLGDLARDAYDAVDARLDHHARHEGRDVRRSGGVSLGQPYVHGEYSGLHAESDEEYDEERERVPRGVAVWQRVEVGRAAHGVDAGEARHEEHEPDVHHY